MTTMNRLPRHLATHFEPLLEGAARFSADQGITPPLIGRRHHPNAYLKLRHLTARHRNDLLQLGVTA